MQPAPNLVIADRFRLTRMLGRGGMGSVWHATHLGLDIPCALKFIEGEYSKLAEAHTRFEREAKAAAQLRSPHVVQILDHGVWQGTPYMAMELLEGEDLGKRLERIRRMPSRDVCAIVTQVARALTKAHGAGIVHRDLKPDNIFLVRDDDREIAKILDFGIAKSATALEGSATKTGAMLGTPYYMSPEQAQGIKAVDHRSDLWSLGVIVYQALTGQLPFESEALGDLLMRIMVAPLPVPSAVAPDLPATFDRWWARAANRDPSQRYQSAKELSDGLALVFGQSQLTEVMDRNEMRSNMGSNPEMGPSGALMQTPPPGYGTGPAFTPQPQTSPVAGTVQVAGTPNPYHQGTPQPYPGGPGGTPQPYAAGPQQYAGTPQPYGGTPQPFQGTPQPQTPGLTTGAPIARTFGTTGNLPQKRGGLYAGVAAGVVLLVVVCVVGVKAMSGKHPAAASSPGAPTTTDVAATAPPPAVSLSPPSPDPGASSAPGADSVTVLSVPSAARPPPAAVGRPTPRGAGAAPPPSPPPAAKKAPAAVDLGI